MVHRPKSIVRKVTMGFLKNLFGGSPAQHEKHYYVYQVKCNRCSEIIEGHVNMDNELSLNGEDNGYIVRMTLIGRNRCFQQIEIDKTFSSHRELIDKNIAGGES